jgi:hypothetical protein
MHLAQLLPVEPDMKHTNKDMIEDTKQGTADQKEQMDPIRESANTLDGTTLFFTAPIATHTNFP